MESHYGHPGGGFRTGPLTGKTRRCGGCAVSCCCHISPGSGKFSIDGTSGQASGLLLENGGSFTVNAGGQASNTTVGHRGTLMLAAGGSLSGRTQLSKGASMVLNGDVVSTGDIVNAGEIYFDNQTTPDAVLSRAVAKGNAPVTFHKLTTSNLTGQGGTINMRVSLDGSNASDQLVINGGQATGKTWLAFTNVGNSNLGVATSGQGIRVVDAQNGATTEEGAFALSRPLQAGAFNYTLNRDSDEDWYLRSENAYRAEVPLYASMLTQAMDYDRILAGSRSHQTSVSGENNSVRLSIQGGHLGHDNNGGIARGATPESSGSYGFVRLEGDLLRTEVAGMSLTTGVYGAAGHSSVDVKDDDGSRAGTVRDDAGSLGGYLNLTHTSSGLWADIVAQGTRHSMKASSDNNDFRARGWGWLGSLETGLPFSITDNLMLEPQLQYTWQGLSLDDGQDNAGYDNFPEISEANIWSTFEQLHQNKDDVFERGVINVFRVLSWNYKTNSPCKFGSKIIVNNLVRWDRWGFHLNSGQQADRLTDLERMLHLFSGKPIPDNRENITIHLDEHIQSVQGKEDYEDEMFSIRYFKKGSAYITFRKPELVDRLNDIIAEHYPDMLSV